MVKFCLGIFLVFVMAACDKNKDAVIRIHLNGGIPGAKPLLIMNDSTYTIEFDSTGLAECPLPALVGRGYGYFRYGGIEFPLYIENKSFHLTLTIKDDMAVPEFSGEGARKNRYLITTVATGTFAPDYKLDEHAFLRDIEDHLNKCYNTLDTSGFDQSFVRLEKQRLYYALFSVWADYPEIHSRQSGTRGDTLSLFYYDYLKSLIKETPSLVGLVEYKEAMDKFIRFYSIRELQSPGLWEITKARIDYVDKNITTSDLSSYLIDKYVTEYVRVAGFRHLDEAASIYRAKVKAPGLKAGFDRLYTMWAGMANGRPSPAFVLTDINEEEVSLANLAGKYLYIGIWDTQHASCSKELSFFQRLERRYRDKDICFVGISCDKDKMVWEETVKKEHLGGIQLYAGKDSVFMKDYMVERVPRFILLDKGGKIMDADVSCPSDAKTEELLDGLGNIGTIGDR